RAVEQAVGRDYQCADGRMRIRGVDTRELRVLVEAQIGGEVIDRAGRAFSALRAAVIGGPVEISVERSGQSRVRAGAVVGKRERMERRDGAREVHAEDGAV